MTEQGTPHEPLPTEDARGRAGVPDGFSRFWTPYRMAYIHGEGKPADASDRTCPFCAAPGKADDDGLIVHRGATCFVLMNLFLQVRSPARVSVSSRLGLHGAHRR